MKNVWPATPSMDAERKAAAIQKIVDANRNECAGYKVTAFNEIAYLLEHPVEERS